MTKPIKISKRRQIILEEAMADAFSEICCNPEYFNQSEMRYHPSDWSDTARGRFDMLSEYHYLVMQKIEENVFRVND